MVQPRRAAQGVRAMPQSVYVTVAWLALKQRGSSPARASHVGSHAPIWAGAVRLETLLPLLVNDLALHAVDSGPPIRHRGRLPGVTLDACEIAEVGVEEARADERALVDHGMRLRAGVLA